MQHYRFQDGGIALRKTTHDTNGASSHEVGINGFAAALPNSGPRAVPLLQASFQLRSRAIRRNGIPHRVGRRSSGAEVPQFSHFNRQGFWNHEEGCLQKSNAVVAFESASTIHGG
jgi:hypothetical protein